MLTELCQELKNWWALEKHTGTFTVEGGSLTADFLADGQYFRVMGSVFNDGVWRFPNSEMRDETFTGSVWTLAIPKEILDLAVTIDAWRDKYERDADSAALSPFQSESFGGYSYAKGSFGSASGSSGSAPSWKAVYASSLNKWRKI